jgi:hypothetical protein
MRPLLPIRPAHGVLWIIWPIPVDNVRIGVVACSTLVYPCFQVHIPELGVGLVPYILPGSVLLFHDHSLLRVGSFRVQCLALLSLCPLGFVGHWSC